MQRPDLDLIVRGGRIVTPQGAIQGDIAVANGKVAKIAPSIRDHAGVTINAAGSWVFPGILDAHVHFNEPGRAEWEGIATGSAALAAGGGTCFFDMPLNSEPPVIDAAALREKRRLGEEKSCLDFALWGGLVPGNLDRLAGLRDAGAIGLKAFMCASGIPSFPRIGPRELREGMKRAARLGLVVAVHAEDEQLAAQLTAAEQSKGHVDAKAYLRSRPVEVELAAIRIALELAGETGCALHIVHVSSPEGIALITSAREQRIDVTAETCPHYLLLTEKDVVRVGAAAKCAPPLRSEARRQGLWTALRAGQIHTIGSDHSPAPAEMKSGNDFFAIWGGIAGCQHGFELLFSEIMSTPAADMPRLAATCARNVAERFRLGARKGALTEGADADFAIVRYGDERVIVEEELWTRHRISPYVGRRSRARVTHTFVRGCPAWADGRLTSPAPRGQFLRPS